MNSLIYDTTRERLTIILLMDEIGYPFQGERGMKRHASEILKETDNLLSSHNLTPADIGAIGVITGPGSFTGIRIGVATVNAFSFAAGAKIIEMTSLEPAAFGKDNALVLIDCAHGYYALKKENGEEEYLALTYEEAEAIALPRYIADKADIKEITDLFLHKLNGGLFSVKAKPFYIKKSSAEL